MNRTVLIETDQGVAETAIHNIKIINMLEKSIQVYSIDKVYISKDGVQIYKVDGCNTIENVVDITFKVKDLYRKTKAAIPDSKQRPATYNKFKLLDDVTLKEDIIIDGIKYNKVTVMQVKGIRKVNGKYTYSLIGFSGRRLNNMPEDNLVLYSGLN